MFCTAILESALAFKKYFWLWQVVYILVCEIGFRVPEVAQLIFAVCIPAAVIILAVAIFRRLRREWQNRGENNHKSR